MARTVCVIAKQPAYDQESIREQMPLDRPDLQHLNAAQGFAALGMYEEGNAELEKIDPFCRALPEVLEVRLEI